MPATAKKVGIWSVVAMLAWASSAIAQSPPATRDVNLVITRDVEPRIAYRGIPLQDHPVGASVPVYPGDALAGVLDYQMQTLVGRSVGDAELSDVAATGTLRTALIDTGPVAGSWATSLAASLTSAGGASLATGGSIGGSVMGATRNLGSLVLGAMAPVVQQGKSP